MLARSEILGSNHPDVASTLGRASRVRLSPSSKACIQATPSARLILPHCRAFASNPRRIPNVRRGVTSARGQRLSGLSAVAPPTRVKTAYRTITNISSLRTTVTDLGTWPVCGGSNAAAVWATCRATVELKWFIGVFPGGCAGRREPERKRSLRRKTERRSITLACSSANRPRPGRVVRHLLHRCLPPAARVQRCDSFPVAPKYGRLSARSSLTASSRPDSRMLGGNQDAARAAHSVWPFVAATTSPESLDTPVECLWGSVRRPRTLTPDSFASRSCSYFLPGAQPPSNLGLRMRVCRGECPRSLKKSRHGRTPQGVRPCRLTPQRAPRQRRVALHLVIRQLQSGCLAEPPSRARRPTS